MLKARDNPFATGKLEAALAFDPVLSGLTWESIHEALESRRFRCAIAGDHGSGKTTLLDALAPRLEHEGFHVLRLFFNDASPPSLRKLHLSKSVTSSRTIVLCDGAGRLRLRHRWALQLWTRGLAGLVITAHDASFLPVAVRLTTSPCLLEALLERIDGGEPFLRQARILWRESNGNMRDALHACYIKASELPA